MPESSAGRGTRGERTRAAIVAAARERFAALGFDGTTVASVAADAGVAEPTVSFHFGSKAGLLVAVLRDHYDRLLAELERVVDVAAPPRRRLEGFARWWVAHLAEHHDLLQVLGRHGRDGSDEQVAAAFHESNRRVTREFDRLLADLAHAGALREGVVPRVVRDAFFGGAEHLLLGWAATGRPADLAAAADGLVDLLLHGALAPSDAGSDGGTGRDPGGDRVRPDLASLDAKLDEVLAHLR